MELPADVGGYTRSLEHLLMVAGFKYGNETGFEQVAGIHQVLGGAGRKVTGDIVNKSPTRIREKRGAGDQIPGLEQSWNFHGHDRITTGQGMAQANAHGHGFVYRPADVNHVLDLGEASVDYFGTGGTRITVNGMDAGSHTSDSESDVALKYFCLAGFCLA